MLPRHSLCSSQDREGLMDSMEALALRVAGAALEPVVEPGVQAAPERQVTYLKLSDDIVLANLSRSSL